MKKLVIFLIGICLIASAIAVQFDDVLLISIDQPNVKINEFESNPDSGNEWVELYNADDISRDISGWKIYDGLVSESLRHTVPNGTILGNNEFYIADVDGLNNGGEFVILKDILDNVLDSTPTFVDNIGDERSWSRVPDGGGNFTFQIHTRGFTNIPTIISNETIEPMCVLESDNVTLSAKIVGICLEEIIFSVEIDGLITNYTGSEGLNDIYSVDIFSNILIGAENVVWSVYGINCFNNTIRNSLRVFYVNSITSLEVSPDTPDGLNGWYVSEPEFTLTNPDGNLSYRWNGEHFNYNGPFDLDGTPNTGNVTGGIHVLKYNSDICEEDEQEFIGMFDFQNPKVTNLIPENGSTIFTSDVKISALLDEVYQSNSGIDESSISFMLDGSSVDFEVDTLGLDRRISYLVEELNEGIHTVEVEVYDNAGHVSIRKWIFFVGNIDALSIDLIEPHSDLYDSRRVKFNLSMNKEVDKLEFINHNDRRPRFKRLCRNCDEYGNERKRLISLSEGENNITLRATVNDEIVEENLFLRVDSKEPRIIRTDPRTGFYQGIFMIEFDEKNPSRLDLNYGNESLTKASNIDLGECFEYRGKAKCNVEEDLSDFDGSEIEYWFNLTDIIGNNDLSRERSVDVDTTDPVVNEFNYTIDGRRINFFFNISEKNFDAVKYIDYDESRPRERTLCSRLKDGICEKRKTFSRGNHNLTINVYDDADNSANVVEYLILLLI
jgi:hypothetical protein